MTLTLTYLGIFLAAIVEGEVAYVAACALIASGHLSPLPVIVAGSLGAAIGDQAFFFLFRKRLHRWVERFPSLERKTEPLVAHVQRRATLMVLLIRFAPGLRIALAAACAYVDMPPLRFAILNGVTAVIWAVGLMILVAWAGPAALQHFGLDGWAAALIVGAAIVVLFKLLGRFEERTIGTSTEPGSLRP
jgi:membrane protein DedA with SNARE-associated domain